MTTDHPQDFAELLRVLACPTCRTASLSVVGPPAAPTKLSCSQCAQWFPIVDGIPVMLPPDRRQPLIDGATGTIWDRVAREQAPDDAAIRARLARHHYVSVMEADAARFAGALPAGAWLVDLGAGWGWPWRTIGQPRILAIDISLDALRLAREWLHRRGGRTNIFLVCGAADQLPVAPASVLGVWSAQMLQHLRPDALDAALTRIQQTLAGGGQLALYWVNWGLAHRLLHLIFHRRVRQRLDGDFYYRRVTGPELAGILEPYFRAPIQIRYNELFFNPDLRVTHDLPLVWLDRALGAVPGLNAALARQVVATVRVPDTAATHA